MFVSRRLNARENHYLNVAYRSFEYVQIFRVHAVQNFSSSRLQSKNVQIKILKNYNFTCCFVWVQNRVAHIRDRTRIEGF
jgi:hypothetical protein